jgi:signal transduction histidine kinase
MSLLVEQEIPAIVWAKLPRGDAWWTGLERYLNLPGVAQSTYLFGQQREETVETGPGTAIDRNLTDLVTANPTPVVSVQLPTETLLRREYFLFIWSARFKGGYFAHRPRSVQPSRSGEVSPLPIDFLFGSYGQSAQLLESNQERKQLLLALCSFEPEIIERAIRGLEQIIAGLSLQLLGHSSGIPTIQSDQIAIELIQHWQHMLQKMPATASSTDLIGQLFNIQLQHYEDLGQRNTVYRKQAEMVESLRSQNEELTTTLRLKDDFLNNVGQELRTPLTTIKTALSLLNSPTLKLPQRQRYMDLIAKECDRQNSLITSLLDLTHLDQEAEQSALPPVRLVDVVPSVASTYQSIAEEKGVRLSYTIPEDLPPVACMTNWLKQIVINLLHNGIKYTPSGGNVWVRAKQQGDYVQLEVRDTGIGIAPSEIPKIFDRFYRVRQSADDSSGAGLGLTIVQQLLLHCGGSISVKSKLDEGSTFNVLLPVYRSPSEMQA